MDLIWLYVLWPYNILVLSFAANKQMGTFIVEVLV